MSAKLPFDDQFPTDDMPLEDLIEIDIDALDEESKKSAAELIETVTTLYHDEKFMKSHPQVRRRVDLELETFRGLIKMRKADEVAHDALLQAISTNKNNASLYRSLAEIQKTSLQITTRMQETMDRLNNLLKGFQLELPFEEGLDEQPKQDDNPKGAHRGSKSFVRSMLAEEE